MKELAGRLTALDPDAGAAVQVIAYFDRLAESRAGLEALVRGAAVLAGVPARLVDGERRVQVRVEADGTRRDSGSPPDPAWPSAALSPDGVPALWLERAGAEPSVVDAVILERAAGAVRRVLDRTRGRAPADDPALVETLLDATAPESARLHAARRLGLDPAARARALAPADGPPQVAPERTADEPPAGRVGAEPNVPLAGKAGAGTVIPPTGAFGAGPAAPPTRKAAAGPGVPLAGKAGAGPTIPLAGRVGVGPAVPVLRLPESWDAARVALRFASEEPGRRVVHAEELGSLALLADLVAPGAEPPADVLALEAAAATAPWLLATLDAVASTTSLRAAATEINVHHSTLQDRLAHAEHLLGWPVRTPQGRFRLQLTLTLRHLTRP
ncbi:helix-turn-helix domain-containing protein [Streptomyces justiciae]|uniref:helix-turn-helix domain-containing protein n=1 Tax=Streptomyces justiciae TaxID=2780140 RepID=UPI002117840E|nr:helix-turn-helix domain-containing protein [Streptomyces justiciae]MCW8380581.1 helix-turn-helix domain-containing protein [Streptomyces justiciae]